MMYDEDFFDKLFKVFGSIMVVWVIVWCCVVIGALVVGIHFLSKVW